MTGNSTNGTYNPPCVSSDIGTTENIFYLLFMLMIFAACLVGNGFVISAVLLSKKLKRSVTARFILSLACSDLLVGCVFIPHVISQKIYNRSFCASVEYCFLLLVADAIFNVSSMLNLLLIAIDRFVAINFPLSYINIIPMKTAKKLIASVWIFSISWPIAGSFNWYRGTDSDSLFSITTEYNSCVNRNILFFDLTYFGIYLSCLIAMTCLYLRILQVAFTQIKHIEATQTSFQLQNSLRRDTDQEDLQLMLPQTKEQATNQKDDKKLRLKKKRRELRATKSVAIVYFAFLMCWFPQFVIFFIVSKKDPLYFVKMQQNNETAFEFLYYFFLQILPSVNGIVNPIIYSFSNRQFREGYKSVIKELRIRCPFRKSDFLPRTQSQSEEL